MHLKEMWSHVGLMAGDPSYKKVRIEEIIGWLNAGQDILAHLLLDVEAWRFEKTAKSTLTSGTAAYTIPEDFDHEVLVRANVDGIEMRQAHRVPMDDFGVIADNVFYNEDAKEPQFTLVDYTLTLFPTPTATTADALEITYRRYPNELTRDRVSEGLTTSGAGSATGTTIVDSSLTQRNDFWNECEAVITSGTYSGQRRIIADFVNSTATLTVRNAFGGQIDNSITFDLYDRSIIPRQHHILLCNYAAACAAQKMGNFQLASSKLGEFNAGLTAIASKYGKVIQPTLFSSEPMEPTNV